MYQKKTNSYMRTLLENKNHLIDKLTNLTDAQKEEIKAFFLKRPPTSPRLTGTISHCLIKTSNPFLS